jgi:hypothetical protein
MRPRPMLERRCFAAVLLAVAGGAGCADSCTGNVEEVTKTITRVELPNPIPAENALPGDPKWRSGSSVAEGVLDAYLSTDAAEANDAVHVRVNANPPQDVQISVYRLGWYGGAGARLLTQVQGTAPTQTPCPLDVPTGLLECAWSDTASFTVGSDWVSGLYAVKVARPDGSRRILPLVVRDRRRAEVYFVSAFNTAEAYNRWGGVSLYVDETGKIAKGRAYAVSLDRPWRETDGNGQMLRWEYYAARLLEREGYDVTYGTSLEFARFGNVLDGIGAVVSAGHDEYWTAGERDQVERGVKEGHTSLAYFGANGGYWRVRLEDGGDGAKLRRIVCFKDDADLDPKPNSTIRFRDPPGALPENALFGAWYESYEIVAFPLVVTDPAHWAFAGTGLRAGELLPGLVGYEFDRIADNGYTPDGNTRVVESPTVNAYGLPDVAHMVERTTAAGTLVFNAGTIFLPLGLSDDDELHDDRVERLTLNVMEKALAHQRPARTLAPAGTRVPAPMVPVAHWASSWPATVRTR